MCHVCSLKNAEEKTDGECFAGNMTTHQGNVKKRGQGNTAYKQRFFVGIFANVLHENENEYTQIVDTYKGLPDLTDPLSHFLDQILQDRENDRRERKQVVTLPKCSSIENFSENKKTQQWTKVHYNPIL